MPALKRFLVPQMPNKGVEFYMIQQSKIHGIAEEDKPKKTKKNRKPTVCADQRRMYGNCGICGYEDTVFQGVDYCKVCGKEEEVLTVERYFRKIMTCCEIQSKTKIKEKYYYYSAVSQIGIRICLSCGAVRGPKCPACHRPCWSKNEQKWCNHCGFRN